MTLALYGKSRGRKTLLILAALLSVAFAVLGGVARFDKAKAAPVDIALTAVTEVNALTHEFAATGTWSIQGNTCWVPGGRFHGFIVVWDATATGSTTTVPPATLVDNAPVKIGYEDTVTGPSILQAIVPAPCDGGVYTDPLSNLGATNVVWPAPGENRKPTTFILGPGSHQICAAVLHVNTNGNDLDADAITCTTQNIVVPAVSIAKTNNTAGQPKAPGASVNYTLTLTVANGPATNVVVTDVLPVGLDAPTAISDGGVYNAGTRTITWNLASVATGKQLTYTAAISLNTQPGTLINTATVNQCTTNCTSTSTVIVAAPNLHPVKSHTSALPYLIGNPFTWSIQVTNTSATTAATFSSPQVVFQDNLPAGATYSNLQTTGSVPAAIANLNCGLASSVITCTASGAYSLPASATFTMSVTATPTQAGALINPATANGGMCATDPANVLAETDETVADNSCSDTVTIVTPNTPTINKAPATISYDTATDTASWVVTVTNGTAGTAVPRDIRIIDTLVTQGAVVLSPAGLPNGPCTGNVASGGLDCHLEPGASVSVAVSNVFAQKCTADSVSNTADLLLKNVNGGYDALASAGPSTVTVPGDPGLCTRTITVCKVITDNNDGVDDAATFGFTSGGTTGGGTPMPANFSAPSATEGGTAVCTASYTALQNETVTITETLPANWNTPSYTFSGGQSNTGTNGAVVATNTGNVTVTFTNVKDSRVIKVCKVITNNNDGVDDSRAFEFDPSNGANLTTPTIIEGAAVVDNSCRTFVAPVDAAATVVETLPTGWNTPTITGATETSGTLATIPASTLDSTVTFTNVKATRTIQVCKIVENNNDELTGQGGTFSFTAVGTTNPIPGVPATEGQGSQCGAAIIAPVSEVTVTESGLPGGFTNASGYPKYQVTGGSLTGGASAVVAAGSSNVVVTFTNRAPTGTIIVNKITIPANDNGVFQMQVGGVNKGAAGGNGATSGSVIVAAGSVSFGETSTTLSAYDSTRVCTNAAGANVLADGAGTGGTVTVPENQVITCTITNTRKPKLTVVKDLYPSNDSGTFDLINGGTTYTGPGGAGYGDNGTTGAQYAAIGSNNFGESAHSGTGLSDYVTTAACVKAPTGAAATFTFTAPTGTVTLVAGDDVTCTIKNERKAKITLTKVTLPASDAQDFTFSATGPNYAPPTITLDTDADSATPESETLSGLAPNTYSLVETSIPSGWLLTGISCTTSAISYGTGTASFQGLANVSVTVAPGDDITCTFTNTKQATITIKKVTLPAGSPQSFPFTLTGGPSTLNQSFGLVDQGTHQSGYVKPGSGYNAAETVPTGWDLTSATCTDGSPVDNIDVTAGETVTCTFTNTQRGKILVDKVTDPAQSPVSFNFTLSGGPSNLSDNFALTDTATPHDSGLIKPTTAQSTYAVSEQVPSAWLQGTTGCTGAVSGASPVTAVVVAPGETVTCTFNNAIKRGSLTIVKQTDPDGAGGSFDFTTTGSFLEPFSPSLSDGQSATRSNLYPGTFTITETDPGAGWHLESIVCTSPTKGTKGSVDLPNRSVSLTLEPAEDLTCVFTNTKRGSITVIKDAVPNNAQDFAFSLTGQTGATLDDDSDSTNSNTKTWDNLAPGSFTLAEVLPNAGWDLTDITCVTADTSDTIAKSLANGTATIDLDAGESVTCTFTNTKRGHIIVRKVTVPASDTTTSFEFNPDWSESNFNLVNGGESDSGALAPGTYSVAELAKTGWDLTSATCSDESPVTAIVLGDGETVTCTFTNTQRGNIQVVKIDNTSAAIPGRPAQWNFTITGPNGFNEARSINLGGGSVLITNVPLGNGYSVVETEAIAGTCPVPNPTATYRTTGPGGSQNLTAGQTITFTFTNTECGVVLSTGNLVINKVNDLNGNHVQDAGETRISGWNITVTGPQFPAGATFATDANGQVILPGIKTGAYTITEETRTSHTVIGVVADDNAPIFTSGGITASVNLAFADEDTVTFYNQPRSSIRVVKTQVVNGASGPGAGWTFTLTGCGITLPIVGVTGSDGVVVFTNLKPANGCSYTVTESVVGGWAVSPSISQVASPAAGQQATVSFTNSRFDVCLDCNPTPTPTPTKTPTPTATPTKTPTNTPAPINTAAGERTPGPQPTPSAPKTGEGIGGGVASLNTLIIVAGLIALSSGLFATGLTRKRNNRR